MKNNEELTVGTVKAQLIGWAGILFFGFCAVASWRAGQGDVSPWFLPFVAIGVALVLVSGRVHTAAAGIRYRTPLGTFGIDWDEITHIELGNQGAFVFFGEGKRLAMVGPPYWSGKDKTKLEQLILNEIDNRKIPVEVTFRADLLMSKSARVNAAT